MPATVAEIRLPADEFALSETLDSLPELSFEIERIVAHDDSRLMPFIWASGNEYSVEDVSNALEADSSTDEIELLTSVDEEWLYRMAWVDRVLALVQAIVEEDGTVLAASYDAPHWLFRLLFPDHEALSRTAEHCQDRDVTFEVDRIYQLDERQQGRFGLTDKQQDALTVGFEGGYYDIPRGVGAQALATELGTSHQALSERLRRAHKSLVKNTVITGREDDE